MSQADLQPTLSTMQRQLWSSQRRNPNSPHQNTALLSTIAGPIDPDRFVAAFAHVVAESDVLRTRIDGDRVVVATHPATTAIIQLPRAETSAWARARASTPLDMTEGGIDSVLIEHSDGTTSWYLNLHHVITDATASSAIFTATASAYYGQPSEIPSYYSWAEELASKALDSKATRAAAHWAQRSPMPRAGRLYEVTDNTDATSTRLPIPLDGNDRALLSERLNSDYASISNDLAWTSLLVTASALYLHRITGSTEMAIGLPVHNRSTPQAEAVFGPVMQVFPVEVEIDPTDTHRALHKRIARSVMTTIRNARPGVTPGLTDVEAVVNVIPRGGISTFGEHGVTTEWIHPGATDPSHLFQLQLTTYADAEPSLHIDVNTTAAGPQRGRVVDHFRLILNELVANPDTSIGRVGLTSPDERMEIRTWGDRRNEAPDTELLPALLERTLPSATLAHDRTQLVGPELLTAVKRTAHWLQNERNVRPGDRVGVQMDRSAAAVLTFLGLWWSGASYVPIDPCQPELRRRSLIERAGCVLTLTELPAHCLDTSGPALELDRVEVDDAAEAYLLFTSGSTGEPKGVPISHRGVADYLHFARTHYLKPGVQPVVPLFSALTFDLTVTSIFLPLLTGGELIVVEADGVDGLKQIAETPRITWMKATPSHLELLLRLAPPENALTTLVIGGEALGARLTADLWAWQPGLRIFNEYGPTEAVVGCMIYEALPSDVFAEVPIGQPAPGVELRIVDAYDHDVPIGSPGELLISSRGVTVGYLGSEPEAGPFVSLDSQRFYRSGDLVRFVAPSVVTYLGRSDEQIKVGGIRLDPTEVEFQLEQHPDIRRAAIRLAGDTLTAWFESSNEPDPLELRTWLANRVPSHAIPAAYVALERLPTTPNGKLDTRALPHPTASSRIGGDDEAQPGDLSDLESTILGIWSAQLGVESIGVNIDFFDLGGDSLAGMQSVFQLGEALGIALPEELIFAHRSARQLAAVVQAGSFEAALTTTQSDELPSLTPGERAMVFAWLNEPDSTANNVGRSYRIDGSVDPDRLRSAAQELIARHLPFRLTYTEPRRVVPASEALEFTTTETLPPTEAERQADRFFAQTFDPDHGPRLRISVSALEGGGSCVVLAMHHALIDEAGLDRLFTDLADLYDGTSLAPMTTGYREFAARQLARSTDEADRAYWRNRPTGSVPTFDSVGEADGYLEIRASFSADHLDHIEGVSGAARSLAAAAEVLGQHTRGSTVEIGMPLSIRSSSDHQLTGYALNVLPLVVDLDDTLSSASTVLNNALTHRNYPFASIVNDRRMADEPIPSLRALLAFGKLGSASIGGNTAQHRVLAPDTATADLTFFVQVRGDEVNLAIEYSGSALSGDTARTLLQQFEDELAVSGHPAERRRGSDSVSPPVPADWLSEAMSGSIPEQPLDDIVAAFASSNPNAKAVTHGQNSLTYSELVGRANAIAHQLTASGTSPGDLVGVVASRSAATVPAILGVLRAGCAYVPIDPDYPADRIATIIEDSRLTNVLVPEGAETPDIAGPTLACTDDEADAPPEVSRSTDDIAYAIFTSGSTGRPKGVNVSHSNIVYSTTVRREVYPHSPTAFLLLSSFAFDSSMVGLWWTLCSGGEIVLPDPGLHTDVDHMGELIQRHNVSHLLAIPSLYQILLSEVGPVPLKSLNTVMVAGEACPPNLVTSHHERLPDVGLHNEYGPTETTVWSHHHLFPSDHRSDEPVPIGRPIPGVSQLVLDETGQPVRAGESGELFVGGPGVTAGYVGQPDLTADRFLTIDGERYYRTGDLVRWLENGALEFLGRVDQQVKIRGVRIELGEIESVALSNPSIQTAAAGTIGTQRGTRLALWVVVHPGADVSAAALKQNLSTRLPSAMVPSTIIELDSMPLTPNGKIDRKQLTVPESDHGDREGPPVPKGTNDTQTGMYAVWSEVLGVSGISATDNFFDLGGDSILSIRIVSGLRRHGIRIKPRDLFDYPTIAELETVAQLQADHAAPLVDRFTGPALLLPMQEWFFQQNFAEPNHWNQSMWFDLSEAVDLDRLERALATVIDHHDSLRAVFTETELGWIQRIAEAVPLVRIQEFNNLPNEAVAAVTRSIESGMDIEGGKLVGAGLFRSSEGDRLFLTIHHLVVDGVSWRPIIEDITAAYRGHLLPDRTTPVATFGAALTELEANPYWERIASDLPTQSAARYPESAGRQLSISIDIQRQDGLFERMLGAIARAHKDVLGTDRMFATLEGHGRAEELRDNLDLSRTVGWFTSMYPIGVDPAQPVVLDAPLGGVGALDQLPAMPRLVINYLGQIDRSIAGTDLLMPSSGIEAGYGARNHRTHDLGIMAHVSGGQLRLTWDFVPDQHPTDLVVELSEAFTRHFQQIPSFDLVQLTDADVAALEELFN